MEKTAKKKIIVQGIIFVISFGIAFFGANYFFSKKKETPNAMLVEASKEMNQSMPKMVDAATRLDSTSVESSTLNYHYTLINVVKDSSDMDFDLVKQTMTAKAQENLDTNTAMKEYRENGVSLHYIFKDKDQNEIFDYTVKHQNQK
ncbi:hypothetical protein [Flavobacterium sp. SM2513]|uniref:hypothetical protein n=1 Tax=Flavobacterium sp. SM2513 TaxID=3424766 RepID=UPI003D7F9E69